MSLLTAPSTHDFLLSAQKAHEQFGLNFQENFDWLFTNGLVVKTPELFLLGYMDDRNDAFVIWWMEVVPARNPRAMLALALTHMPHYRPRVGWARLLKGKPFKWYLTDRLLQLSKGQ